MKNLIITTVVGLTLVLPAVTHAGDKIFGVDIPATGNKIENKVNKGATEKDFMSLYIFPESRTFTTTLSSKEEDMERDYISAFGIKIPVKPGS